MSQITMPIAKQVIIVTESNKFGQKSFAKFANISDIAYLVTDKHLSKQNQTILSKAGVKIFLS